MRNTEISILKFNEHNYVYQMNVPNLATITSATASRRIGLYVLL